MKCYWVLIGLQTCRLLIRFYEIQQCKNDERNFNSKKKPTFPLVLAFGAILYFFKTLSSCLSLLNRAPVAVEAIRKRLSNRNPKIVLLTLTVRTKLLWERVKMTFESLIFFLNVLHLSPFFSFCLCLWSFLKPAWKIVLLSSTVE